MTEVGEQLESSRLEERIEVRIVESYSAADRSELAGGENDPSQTSAYPLQWRPTEKRVVVVAGEDGLSCRVRRANGGSSGESRVHRGHWRSFGAARMQRPRILPHGNGRGGGLRRGPDACEIHPALFAGRHFDACTNIWVGPRSPAPCGRSSLGETSCFRLFRWASVWVPSNGPVGKFT
jgi:hypothetical protein